MSVDAAIAKALESSVPGEAPLVESLIRMHAGVQGQSGMDDRTYLLVRIAALVSIDAPATSYLLNLTAADEVGVTADDVRGVLIAVAPLVGTARALSGVEKALAAIGASRHI